MKIPHHPLGNPRGVSLLVLTVSDQVTDDQVTDVTYGGQPMTLVESGQKDTVHFYKFEFPAEGADAVG